jgi:hypothetical protein
MTPNRAPDLLPHRPRVLLPGLKYARVMIDTAITICENLDKRPPDPDRADDPSHKKPT